MREKCDKEQRALQRAIDAMKAATSLIRRLDYSFGRERINDNIKSATADMIDIKEGTL